ncbi:hypothetical protein LJR066_003342 [Acidovorax sp. LjRoot66]|uniref:hypothetical protein n=1 Tax=Acidovorax sp. LjRoot66 TaxID=3342334 RepID=UPI003ECD9BDB
MRQTYEIWDVLPGRVARVSVESVIDDWEGFRILLRDHETDRMLRIGFNSQVAFQCRDEGDLDGEAARSDGLGRGCFYRVHGSEYQARFIADSARQFRTVKHFAIITDVDCIDVLATDEPTITQL